MTRSPPLTRILVAEDDARTARVLARLLRDDHYEVEVVADVEAAIERLERGAAPDVVVTDLRMPFGGDLRVARCARRARAGLPIVVISDDPEQARGRHETM